ncbi:MAG: GNAT family N-acetyltransferase [Verrucomicrobiaceae bacterium]
MTIRPAERADASGFVRLVKELAIFEKLEPPDEAAQARLIEDVFGEIPRIEVWLAVEGTHQEPVGYMILLETYSSFLALPTLYLEDVFVLPERRRHGIGGALLRKAVELARERGCGRVEWAALDWNTNARAIYEQKLGVRRMREWVLYRMGQGEMDAFLAEPK